VLGNFLILVGGIIALNVLLVAGLVLSNWRDSSRRRREIRELESIWRTQRRGMHVEPHSGRRRLASVLLVTMLLGATTALASPQGRGVLTSAIAIVTRGLHRQPAEQTGAYPGDDGSLRAAGGNDVSLRGPSGSPGPREGARSAGPTAERTSADPSSSTLPSAGSGLPSGPSAVTIVTAVSISSGQVRVGWVDVPRESGYHVERSMDGVTDWTGVAEVGQDVTSTVDGGLAADTTYYYRVFAGNPGGDSTASSVASATTSLDPATPTIVTAVAISASQIELNWTNVDDETGYRVERMLAGDVVWLTLATTGEDITRFTDVGLAGGTAYYYRVFATNASGDSAASDVVLAMTSSDPTAEP
jgi:hypothetical protein